MATTGWGHRLLSRQDADGRWAGALSSPKRKSTTYTLLLLYWLGLPPGNAQALAACRVLSRQVLVGDGATWPEPVATLRCLRVLRWWDDQSR